MAVKLYAAGETHTLDLIRAGKVDETSAWTFSAADEDKILGTPPNWTAYGSWHLGHDATANRETKAAWSYPFGKDGQVYRSAMRAIRTRASQQNEQDIFDAAGRCMDEMDQQKAAASAASVRRARAGGSRGWYRFLAQATPDVAELLIYDEIGVGWFSDGVTAKQFITDLMALSDAVKTLRIHVNSPGGDVFDAVAIANMLRAQSRDHGRMVEMMIEGLAASAATIVTSAGDSIRIGDNAMMMIHNPWGLTIGSAADMRQTAEELDQIRSAILATYRWVSPLSVEELSALMDATTWMNAEEAVKNGFATEIVSGMRAAASLRPDALRPLGEVPEKYRARVAALLVPSEPPAPALAAPAPPAAIDAAALVRMCQAADCLMLVDELLEAKASEVAVKARIAEAKEIRGLCATAKLPELAEGFIRGHMPVADVKRQLTTITAKLDAVEIDPTLAPSGRPKPTIDTRAIYRERNQLAAKGVTP